MSGSTERTPRRRAWASAAFAGLALCLGGPASGEDGLIRIRESALNDFAAAVQPLTLSQNFGFTVWVPNPFLLPPVIPIWITCNASASVTDLVFDITPGSVTVRGNVNGTICGFPYQAALSTGVNVFLNQTSRTLSFLPGPMTMFPVVNILGFGVSAPFAVTVHPSLTVPAIPLDAAPFEIETAAGPRSFVLVGRNLELSRHNGYLEIKGDALFR